MAGKVGQKVWADNGDGKRIAFVFEAESKQEDGTNKAVIQVGTSLYHMAYREPSDDDKQGTGLTYWLI